jgi:hypothetical protein
VGQHIFGGLLVTNRHVRHDHSGIAYRERATIEHSKVTPGGTATSRLASKGELFCRFPCQSSYRRNNVTEFNCAEEGEQATHRHQLSSKGTAGAGAGRGGPSS